MMTRAPGLRILLLACTASLTGCLLLEQELVLEEENRGRMTVRLSLPEDVYDDVVRNSRFAVWFDPIAGASRYSAAAGFGLNRYRSYLHEGRRHLAIETRIDDFEKALASGVPGPFSRSREGEHTRLEARLAATSLDLRQRDDLADLTRGMRLVLTVRVPGVIVETNATDHGKRKATWVIAPDRHGAIEWPEVLYVTFR